MSEATLPHPDAASPSLAQCAPLMGAACIEPTSEVVVLRPPSWALRHEVARAGGDYLVLFAPMVPASAGQPPATPREAGQALLDAPAGRYVSDAFDVARRTWIGRETAGSPPLVLGVPGGTGAVVLRLRRL